MSAAKEAYDELVTDALPARQRYLVAHLRKSFTLLILFAIMVDFLAVRQGRASSTLETSTTSSSTHHSSSCCRSG